MCSGLAAVMEGGCDRSFTNLAGHKPVNYGNREAMARSIESYATKYKDLKKQRIAFFVFLWRCVF